MVHMEATNNIKRVYLIEDDVDDCEIFCQAFKDISPAITLEYAHDCIGTIQKIQTFQPDLIFLDLYLPKIPGLQCLRHIHLVPAIKYTPVIVYSAWGNEFDIN